MRTETATGRARQRGGWLTAAAVILFIEGGLGLLYLPILGPPGPVSLYVAVTSGACFGAATGILLRREWGRALGGLVAGASLLFDGLAVAGSVLALVRGESVPVDPFLPIGLVAWLVVLFAVTRRW